MEYCTNCDIVHDVRDCPLCEAKDEMKDLQQTIDDLQGQVSELENLET